MGIAAIMSDDGTAVTRAALESQSIRLANLLRGHGLARGDRVAILVENRLEWLVAMTGVRRAEMFFVPVNWHLTPAEIRFVIGDSDARAIITTATLIDVARDAIDGLGAIGLRLAIGGGEGFADWSTALAAASPAAPADERDGGSMPYSSGTTGRPKGILRALPDLPYGTPNGLERLLTDLYGLNADGVYLCPAPLYHSAPIGFVGAVLGQGGRVVVMPSFDAKAALAAIERHRITHAQFVPTHFVRMLRLPAEVRARYDLSSLTCVVHAAAPCAPDVKRAMIDWLGPIVHEYYAGSERCGLTAIDSAEWLAHPGSVGRTRNGAIHILDDDGEDVPAGEIGTIYFEDPVPFTYYKDAARTMACFNAHGWGTHGDMGHVDADGYLYIADRRTDLILSGGVNIYPQEIENVLAVHPDVADVAVIGIAHPEFGQEVKAVVQRSPGARADAAALIAYAREHLAAFKAPRSVDFVETLPRHPNGKLLRRELVELYR